LESNAGGGGGGTPPAAAGSEFTPQIAAHAPLRYAITDRSRLVGDEPQRQATLLRNAARGAADGLDFVQLREKDLAAGALAALARQLLAALGAGHPAPKLLINSRADVAIAVAAAGVHLTSAPGELTPSQVRRLYAAASLPEPIVSVSCHTLADVARAASSEPGSAVSLILFGPVFEKVVAARPVGRQPIGDQPAAAATGLDLLRAACAAAAPTPVLALGGITQANTAACLAAGAAGIAAIRLFIMEQFRC
jgi:thiamine-phosphate pyrophosphorylase